MRSESNETFYVNLTGAVNATLGDAQGAGNVRDNDRAPSVAVSDAGVTTNEFGTFAVFTVYLSARSDKPVTVNVATAGNTAVAAVDYVAHQEGVYFPPGVTAQNVVVLLLNNPSSTGKRFYLTTTSAVNAALADKLGACIIP